VNQACCVLKPVGGLRVDYLHYWFVAHKSGVVNLAVGAGQPNLSQDLIRQLRIPAPDLKEQGKIVDALREAEHDARHRIARLEARGRLLAERRQALITAAVTGQLDVTTVRPAHDRNL
ncbi:restriction endonuclease subunit S, partial [Streptomyces hydrogenans]|uniref:restriction endonuclease subunit S n=1 Tax=Streptomyces hydrogenans TaxID=1873719 RepID=UPI0036287B02